LIRGTTGNGIRGKGKGKGREKGKGGKRIGGEVILPSLPTLERGRLSRDYDSDDDDDDDDDRL